MAEESARILIVDDEPSITEFVSYAMRKEGFTADVASNGEDALELMNQHAYDLFVLDIMLPVWTATSCAAAFGRRRPRRCCSSPRAIPSWTKWSAWRLAATTISQSRSACASCWRACVRLLRRGSGADLRTGHHAISASGITVDEDAHTAKGDKGEIDLTPREFELLVSLMKNAGKVVSREDLLREAWGWEYLTETKTVDTHIKRLRDKIGRRRV